MSYWVGCSEQLAEQCLSADAIRSYISLFSTVNIHKCGQSKIIKSRHICTSEFKAEELCCTHMGLDNLSCKA